MDLFKHNIKNIKGSVLKNGDVNGTCKTLISLCPLTSVLRLRAGQCEHTITAKYSFPLIRQRKEAPLHN